MLELIEQKIREKYGNPRQYCLQNGFDYSNFMRTLKGNIDKLDKIESLIAPLGLEININEKKEN